MGGMKINTNNLNGKMRLESLSPGQVFMKTSGSTAIYMKLANAETSDGIDGTDETVVNLNYAELEVMSTSQEVVTLESSLSFDK